MKELNWINIARQFVGLKEIKGTKHNPAIVQMLDEMGKFSNEARAWWRDDDWLCDGQVLWNGLSLN